MSNPTWPVYTFRVNLNTLNSTSTLFPYTQSEAAQFKYTRSTWLATMFPGAMIADKEGDTFTAYGLQAQYLKNLYVTGSPNDVLQLVS